MTARERPRLFLIDGHALIYRAFFALISRPLRTSRGENTSAAWGVVNFLLRLRERYHPDYVAWVLDAGDSHRRAIYPEYKSTREKLDAELQQDFDLALEQVRALLEAFRIPVVTVPGFEADDVIGTLAAREAAADLQVVIVSGDKDFYQLIRPGVALLNPGRGGPAGVDEQWVDESNAAERLGVPPRQVIDFLSLVGDSSDNVPGVRGVGEKTATKLLEAYDDLDAILAHAAEVSGKRAREALLAEADNARLSKTLVTIRTDVPVDFELDAAKVREPDGPALLSALTKFEFHSLVSRLQSEFEGAVPTTGDASPVAEPVGETTVVDDPADLTPMLEALRSAGSVAIKAVAVGAAPRDAELVGLAFATDEAAWYLPLGHRPRDGELAAPEPIRNLDLAGAALEPLREYLGDPGGSKIGHDLKLDWELLRGAGVELGGGTFDTMLASFVLDPGRRSHDLATLSLDHLGRGLPADPCATGKGRPDLPIAVVPVDEAAAYFGAAVRTMIALHDFLTPRLEQTELAPLLANVEIPLIAVLVDMEWRGIAIDRAVFDRLSRELTTDLVRLEAEIAKAAGGSFNLNSPKQLAGVLFEKLQLPVVKKTKTGPSTDADVLEQLAAMGHDVPRLLLEYRELQKLRSTYVDVLPARTSPRTGRIHTTFNQTGAATGRLSSSDPNLQNIPIRTARGEEIRRGFVPTDGFRFVVADYSQIELRLMAHFSGDPAFVEAFQRGGDIHRQTAAVIFGVEVDDVTAEMRARAKTINFATIYGQGPFALSRQLGIPMDEAKAFISQYFERFAGVRAYLDGQIALARRQGYVETLFKRRRYIPEIKDKNFNTRSFGERLSQNSPLQGSAADLIKIAMARIHDGLREQGGGGRLLLQVHDELVLEAPADQVDAVAAIVRRHMEGAAQLQVPLVVDIGIGDNWLDAKR
ncbi:MAG: DNA polymerase I [Gemmatimonadales bacterium]